MKFVFSILIIICSVTCFAQTPGYMGKRFVVGYGINASPRLVASGGKAGINLLHEGFIEFAMKKNVSVGFSAKFYNTMYANTRDVKVFDYSSSSIDQLNNNPTGFTSIKARNYALYFKFYKENYLAPWGKYFILGATLNTFESTYDPDNMYVSVSARDYSTYDYTNTYYSDFGSTTQSYKRFDIMIGNGRSRIIGNRVILDYGYTINLLALTATVFDAPDDNIGDSNYLSMSEYIEKTSAARIRGVNRFNVFLKVGVLLF